MKLAVRVLRDFYVDSFGFTELPDFVKQRQEMIEIVSSLIEKLQQIEDKYYYTLDLDSYLLALEDDEYED